MGCGGECVCVCGGHIAHTNRDASGTLPYKGGITHHLAAIQTTRAMRAAAQRTLLCPIRASEMWHNVMHMHS